MALVVAGVIAVLAMASEAPLGARAGAATRAEAAAVMAATTAATEEAEEVMEVADTVVGEEAPVRAAGARRGTATPRVERTTRVRPDQAAAAPPRTAIGSTTSL